VLSLQQCSTTIPSPFYCFYVWLEQTNKKQTNKQTKKKKRQKNKQTKQTNKQTRNRLTFHQSEKAKTASRFHLL